MSTVELKVFASNHVIEVDGSSTSANCQHVVVEVDGADSYNRVPPVTRHLHTHRQLYGDWSPPHSQTTLWGPVTSTLTDNSMGTGHLHTHRQLYGDPSPPHSRTTLWGLVTSTLTDNSMVTRHLHTHGQLYGDPSPPHSRTTLW